MYLINHTMFYLPVQHEEDTAEHIESAMKHNYQEQVLRKD